MKPSCEELRQRLQAAVGGRFRVLEPLSEGPLAVVFRATDATTKGDVALTTFTPAALASTGVFERLARAVDRAAGLAHPGILAPFALERWEDVVFYPMPVARGDTVENRFRAGTPAPLDRVVDLARGVGGALDYAHGRGVVHCALKPSNIFVDGQGAACVSDFGVERAILGDGGAYAPGSDVGQAYQAPEQWRRQPVDGRTDQHALAIIAYELLTGKRRVDAPDVAGIRTMDPVEVPPNLPLQRGIGLHVNAALRRALSASPQNRFPTVGAFVNGLAGDDGRPTTTVSTGRRRRLWSRSLGVPIALASLGAVLLLVLGGPQRRRRVQQEWRALTGRLASAQVHLPFLGKLPGPRGPIASPRLPSSTTSAGGGNASSSSGAGGGTTGGTSSPPVVYRGPGASRIGAPGLGPARIPPLPGIASVAVPLVSTAATRPRRSLLTRLADFLGIGPGDGSSTMPVSTTTTLITPLAPEVGSASSPSANGPGSASSEGCLTVAVDSGTAVVIIDGVPRGTTPYATCLGEGHHSVSVHSVSASYEPGQVAVSISKGDTTSAVFHRAAATALP